MTITGESIHLVLPTPHEIVGLSDDLIAKGIAAAQAAIARLQAVQVRMIGRLNQLRDGDRSVADEIAPELGMSRHGAQRLVALSDDLLTRLPRTLAAMDRGELDVYKASKITDVTAALPPEKCRAVDAALAGRVAGKDPAQIRRAARDLVHRIDGDGANERAVKRREDRKIELCHDDDAMATLLAYLPAETASAIYSRVDTIARTLKVPGEGRTLEQLRSDVFSDLLLGKLTGHSGVLGTIFLHIPIGTALGITEHGCVLEGHGPTAPRGAVSYHLSNREGFGGRSLGLMAYLDLKRKGNKSMPGNQWLCPGVWGGALGDPRDMAKAELPEPQSPEGASGHPSERRLTPTPVLWRHNRSVATTSRTQERCPVRVCKEMSAAPRGALPYSRFSREEFGGTFLDLMPYLDPKGEGDRSMAANQ